MAEKRPIMKRFKFRGKEYNVTAVSRSDNVIKIHLVGGIEIELIDIQFDLRRVIKDTQFDK